MMDNIKAVRQLREGSGWVHEMLLQIGDALVWIQDETDHVTVMSDHQISQKEAKRIWEEYNMGTSCFPPNSLKSVPRQHTQSIGLKLPYRIYDGTGVNLSWLGAK